MSTRRRPGDKQAYRVIHQPVSRGLTVFADAWLSGWLAEISADLRGSGSALEAIRNDALYKSTYFTFTDRPTIHPVVDAM